MSRPKKISSPSTLDPGTTPDPNTKPKPKTLKIFFLYFLYFLYFFKNINPLRITQQKTSIYILQGEICLLN